MLLIGQYGGKILLIVALWGHSGTVPLGGTMREHYFIEGILVHTVTFVGTVGQHFYCWGHSA